MLRPEDEDKASHPFEDDFVFVELVTVMFGRVTTMVVYDGSLELLNG